MGFFSSILSSLDERKRKFLEETLNVDPAGTLKAIEQAPAVAAQYYGPAGNRVLSEGLMPDVPSIKEDVETGGLSSEDVENPTYGEAALRGLGGTAEMLTSPTNAAIALGTGGLGLLGRAARPAQRAVSLGFGASMVPGVVRGIKETAEKVGEEGFSPRALQSGVGTAAEGVMTGLAFRHGLGKGKIVPEKLPAPVEEARIGNILDKPNSEAIPALRTTDYLNQHPAFRKLEEWHSNVLEVAKKTMLGLDKEVLPVDEPASRIAAARMGDTEVQAGENTRFAAAHPEPWYDASGNRNGVNYSNIRMNPLTYIDDLHSDISTYPQYGEALMGTQGKGLGEELLRRMIWTINHELAHSAGAHHPIKDSIPDVFNQETGKYFPSMDRHVAGNTKALDGTDIQFERILRQTMHSYESGAYDNLIEGGSEHAHEWVRMLTDAREIQRGRKEIPAPRVDESSRTDPARNRLKAGGGEGVFPGGLSRDTGATSRAGIEYLPEESRGPNKIPKSSSASLEGPDIKEPPVAPKDLPQHGYKDWVNAKAAASIHGKAAVAHFKDLASQGMDWIHAFELDSNSVPGGAKVARLFKKLRDIEVAHGVPVKDRENYLYHIFKEDAETVAKTFRRLGIRPGFTKERVHETYAAGEAAGLHPKFTNPAEIIGARVAAHKRSIANVKFWNHLQARRLVKPANKAPQGWQVLRNTPFATDKRGKSQLYSAPPKVAQKINRYLDSPISSPNPDFLQKTAKLFTDVKNVVVSAGIPKTAFNIHGINIARRVASSQGTVGGSLWKAVSEPFKLLNSQKGLTENLHTEVSLRRAARFVEKGMTMNLEDHPVQLEGISKQSLSGAMKEAFNQKEGGISGGYSALRKMHQLLFEDPLFQGYLPSRKLAFAEAREAQLLKYGVAKGEATRIAAHDANTQFGGINWVEEGRDPVLQTVMRIALIAPDWAESNLRLGKGAVDWVRNPNDPKFKLYRNVIRNTITLVLLTKALSKITDPDEESPVTKDFQLAAGETASGRNRYLRLGGTAEDFTRLPYELVTQISQGDLSGVGRLVAARLHPVMQGIINIIKNKSYSGKDITGGKLPFLTQAGRLLNEVTSVTAPSYLKAPISALTGNVDLEESLSQAVEAPVSYSRPIFGQTSRRQPLQRGLDRSLTPRRNTR